MTVEAATTISGTSGFTATLPTDNDPLSEGAAHLRLLKSVLQTTFPNVTAPVTATTAALNSVTGALSGGSFVVPPTSTAHVGGNLTLTGQGVDANVSLTNVLGGLSLAVGGVTALSVSSAGVVDAGSFTAQSINQQGAPLIPRGVIVGWSGSAAAVPAGWWLCDGSNGTPNLVGAFIMGAGKATGTLPAGSTGGAATATAATTLNGSHNHTGATAQVAQINLTGTTDQQGAHSHGGNDQPHSLTIAELPAHQHTVPGGLPSNTFGGGSDSGLQEGFGTNLASEFYNQPSVSSVGGGAAHQHGIVSDGAHAHNLNISPIAAHAHGIYTDGQHAHNVTVPTLPPYYALALIMKL